MKEVYQICDSRTCKYEICLHRIKNDKVTCSKCEKEYKIKKINAD